MIGSQYHLTSPQSKQNWLGHSERERAKEKKPQAIPLGAFAKCHSGLPTRLRYGFAAPVFNGIVARTPKLPPALLISVHSVPSPA